MRQSQGRCARASRQFGGDDENSQTPGPNEEGTLNVPAMGRLDQKRARVTRAHNYTRSYSGTLPLKNHVLPIIVVDSIPKTMDFSFRPAFGADDQFRGRCGGETGEVGFLMPRDFHNTPVI